MSGQTRMQRMTYASQMNLEQLFGNLPEITPWLAGEYYSALVVCLEHHNHRTGIAAALRNLDETIIGMELIWSKEIDDTDRRVWGHPRNAVEQAAEGLAWLIIHRFTDYTVIGRSSIGDGVDFWLGDKADVDSLVFQRKARMETKGRLSLQYDSQIQRVVHEALRQSARSDYTNLPVYVVVAEFSRPVVYLVQK